MTIQQIGLEKPTNVRQPPFFSVAFRPEQGVLWGYIERNAPVCFTPDLIQEMRKHQVTFAEQVKREVDAGHQNHIRYQVLASHIPGIFSLGGDLAHFANLIESRDRDGLIRYGTDCVDLVYWTSVGYNLPVTTIALVQGTAQGGGFEAALAAHIIVTERQCKFGFPEIMFNLFPGMGGAHYLSRRVPQRVAEQILSSGKMYTAQELSDLGIVDIVAEPGEGENAVRRYIKKNDKRFRGMTAVRQVLRSIAPIEREALVRTVTDWADLALRLQPRDLKTIRRLQQAQAKLSIPA